MCQIPCSGHATDMSIPVMAAPKSREFDTLLPSPIYAAGDVLSGSEEQIATAVGEGSKAAITLYTDIINKKF